MTDIVDRLRQCENDPMWADHAEIPKRWCRMARQEIERLRAMVADMELQHKDDLQRYDEDMP